MMHPRLPLHREDSRLKPLLLLLTTLIIMTCEGMSDVYAAIIVLLSSLESINQSKHREVKNQNTKFKRKKCAYIIQKAQIWILECAFVVAVM